MLEERAVVGTRAERIEGRGFAGGDFLDDPSVFFAAFAPVSGEDARAETSESVDVCFRIENVGGGLVHEFLKGVTAAQPEKAAAIRVGIQIEHGFFFQFVCVRFDPFGGTDQAGLFGVPASIDDGSTWLPTVLGELA